MEPWQRGGRSKFSAENAWHTLKKDAVEEKYKVCLADWQKTNKHDDTLSKDTFTLVIGHEVNVMDKVYPNQKYHIGAAGQTGHSFFYVTKNGIVYSAFSFGPANHEHLSQTNEGTVDYEIGQVFRFHRFSITREQAIQIKKQTDIFRGKVNEPTLIEGYSPAPYGGMIKTQVFNPNKMYYSPLSFNQTCAAEARAVLTKANIKTPSGLGSIDVSGDWVKRILLPIQTGLMPMEGFENTITGTSPVKVTNPYDWYNNIAQKYGDGELYKGRQIQSDGFSFVKEMFILEGEDDPLIQAGQDKKVLHLR